MIMDCDRPLVKLLLACGSLIHDIDPLTYCSTESHPIKTLSRMGLIHERDAVCKIADRLGIQFLDLENKHIQKKCTIKNYARRVPSQLCFTYRMIPLYEEFDRTIVAFANPLDIDAQKQIQFVLGNDICPVIAEEDIILELLGRYFPPSVSGFISPHFDRRQEVVEVELLSSDSHGECDLDEIEENTAPVVQLINRILIESLKLRASDIHFDATPNGLDVRYRIDGVMQHIFDTPKRFQRPVVSKMKLMAGMNIAERRMPQDGRFGIKYQEATIDVRVSCVPTAYGEKIVARLLRSTFDTLTFSSLGIEDTICKNLEADLSLPGKMILVTGPTGSGKTTTLYAALRFLTDGTSNIQTVEDPIEYKIPGVNQIQINEAAKLTFANCLRAILRQDPDVIMVGEIRDAETATIALQAAQTGHLVISTLHTNDAPSALSRLLSLGCDPFVLASSLAGVMAQRLIRKICPCCATPAPEELLAPDRALLESFGVDPGTIKYGSGCEKCRYTGYFGRVGLYSYLRISPKIAELIHAGTPLEALVTEARTNGFQDLTEAAIQHLTKGLTDVSEIRPYLTMTREYEEVGGSRKVVHVDTPSNRSVSEPRRTIVLVEDDPANRTSIAAHLRTEHYRVVEIADGIEALKHLRGMTPDLIITGLGLPGIDGKQLLQHIRAQQELKHTPVIVLTSADSDENEIELLQLGASDFISRSRSPAILIRRVSRALQ